MAHDAAPATPAQVDLSPGLLFDEPAPILFDEWQRVPAIWDHVRRHVDDLRGLCILTGSATPTDARELHSGAGWIRVQGVFFFEKAGKPGLH